MMKAFDARKTFTGVRWTFLPTCVRENAKTWKSACEQAGDSVRECKVDRR